MNIEGVCLVPRVFSNDNIKRLIKLTDHVAINHDDDGGHHMSEKLLILPWVAKILSPFMTHVKEARSIDEKMNLYKLTVGAGAVHPHQDLDFDGPDGTQACFSILVYLNNLYTGGETIFRNTQFAPHLNAGDALIFRHNILHEGLMVKTGIKYVLKTDIFVQRK